MDRKDSFRLLLESVCGGGHLYLNAPENFKMEYPAVVYKLLNPNNRSADDITYMQQQTFQVIVIYKRATSDISTAVSKLPRCKWIRGYVADGLNHDVYEIIH